MLLVVGMALSRRRITDGRSPHPDDVLPPSPRSRHRPKSDRGLPSDENISALARDHLTWQRDLWPDLVKRGLLPEPTDDVIGEMVSDYKSRHRGAVVEPEALAPFVELDLDLFGQYGRYSAEGSSPNSMPDQLVKCLKIAARERRFIPWVFVYGDYSVSGLDDSRVGYSAYKRILKDKQQPIKGTYIDDFTRASRDEIEWWRLARLSRRLKKRMLGASDGFDVNHPMWDLHLTIFALLSRIFLNSLRQKVRRGMEGAARRGTCIGRLGFGFTRCLLRDADGRVIRNHEGDPLHGTAQFPAYIAIRREICDAFANQNMSEGKIALQLNQRHAADWDRWTARGINGILKSPANLGVFINNRYHAEIEEYEDEKGELRERQIKIENPRSEWVVAYDPSLAVISLDLWRKIRRKLAARHPRKRCSFRRASRNQNCATTLFSGTLFCEHCGRELTLSHSDKRYRSMYCPNGHTAKGGCKLKTNKTVTIIENALLTFLLNHILTEEAVGALVVKANDYIAELTAQPPAELGTLRAEIKRIKQKMKHLVPLAEDAGDENARLIYHARIRELGQLATAKAKELRKLQPVDTSKVRPLEEAQLKTYLSEARSILNQETPVAAEALRALTGPIKITQLQDPNRKWGATWVAKFSPKLIDLLRFMSKRKDCPDFYTLGLLSSQIWITCEPVQLPIELVRKYERFAASVLEHKRRGVPASVTKRLFGLDHIAYHDALRFAETGERPPKRNVKQYPRNPSSKGRGRRNKYKALIPIVLQLHDQEHLPFAEIARQQSVSAQTIARAYEAGHPELLEQAITNGTRIVRDPNRAPFSPTELDQLNRMICENKALKEIAEIIGCTEGTVRWHKRRMHS
jgi:DNA-binding CsgD family transcriptional regulator/DNA invertase Pin-like site-specific DNA recombinase